MFPISLCKTPCPVSLKYMPLVAGASLEELSAKTQA